MKIQKRHSQVFIVILVLGLLVSLCAERLGAQVDANEVLSAGLAEAQSTGIAKTHESNQGHNKANRHPRKKNDNQDT